MALKTIFLDAETYYDKQYSLRNMSPAEYILDPRFELILVSVCDMDGKPYYMDARQFERWLAQQNPEELCIVTFNSLFDMCILSYRYGFVPKLMIDVLGMCRAKLAKDSRSLSLESVAKLLGVGTKGTEVVHALGKTAGMMKADGTFDKYGEYCCNDTDMTRSIFKGLYPTYPKREFLVMDLVLRCAVQPQFKLNADLLHTHLHWVRQQKQLLMDKIETHLDADRSVLMSNERFADVLRKLGVEPPTKISKATGEITYAFAKTDEDFTDLLEHDDPYVQALVAARLGVKSTLEETRCERLIKVSQLTKDGKEWAKLPVPLKYSGAHTHRLSGDWKWNLQNLPRPDARNPAAGRIREALEAPKGHVVLAVDSSQIECRMTAWFCGASKLVQIFADKGDPYCDLATKIFKQDVTKTDKPRRFVGKQTRLGSIYGLGPPRFMVQVRSDARKQNVDIDVDLALAQECIKIARESDPEIPAMWKKLGQALWQMMNEDYYWEYKCVKFKYQEIVLPSGLSLYYKDLKYDEDLQTFTFQHQGRIKYINGPKVLENIIQSLARIVIMDAAVDLKKDLEMLGVTLALQAHDELVYIVPEDIVKVVQERVLYQMRVRPSWAPELPLDAEANYGKNYAETK